MDSGTPKARGSRNVSSRTTAVKHRPSPAHYANNDKSIKDEEVPKFDVLEPPKFDRRACLKYYSNVEGQLKKWASSWESDEVLGATMKSWHKIFPYIEGLLQTAEMTFELQTEYFLRKEVDNRVWKYGIYAFIKIFRSTPSTDKILQSAYQQLLEAGRRHFEHLIKELVPKMLNISLDTVFDRTGFLRTALSPEPNNVDHMLYRVFIAIGDLYRYQYLASQRSKDLNMAKSLYLGARFCDTVKCRAYHQLALTSRINGDLVGMIYNFVRAAHGPVPADGARQQLLLLFGDVARQYSKRKNGFWFTRAKTADLVYNSEWRVCFNIWIRPGTKTNLPEPPIPPQRLDHLKSLTFTDIYARFSIIFGNFIGILYTNIGTDTLEQVGKDLLVYFEGLVVQNHNKLETYSYIIALLLFLVARLEPDGFDESRKSQVLYMKNLTIDFTAKVIVILAGKLEEIIACLDWKHPMLGPVTASILLWSTWLQRRKKVLRDLRQSFDSDTNFTRRVLISTLHKLWEKLKVIQHRSYSVTYPVLKPISDGISTEPLGSLPEYIVLDGFNDVTLPSDINTSCFFDDRFTKYKAQVWFRLSEIAKVLEVFVGGINLKSDKCLTTNPIEGFYTNEFNIMNTIFYGDAQKPKSSKKNNFRPDCNNARTLIPKQRNALPVPNSKSSSTSDALCSVSSSYKIYTQLSMVGARTEMVIRPKYVVLDTNTIIRYTQWIQILVHVMPSPIIIPTTVLLELRGLCKGVSPRTKRKEMTLNEQKQLMMDTMELTKECTKALEFLETNKKYLRVVSMDGKALKVYKYKTQKIFEPKEDLVLRNDEKILETCMQLELGSRTTRSLDQPLRLNRNTILLTDDVSLRVRAHAQTIPSRDIQSFTNWILGENGR